MRISPLLIAALCLCCSGCSTTAFHANGSKWFTTYADATTFSAVSGGESITMTGMSHSRPTRAALLGANRIVGTVGSAAVGIAIPGSGVAPLVGRAVVTGLPHVTTPAP